MVTSDYDFHAFTQVVQLRLISQNVFDRYDPVVKLRWIIILQPGLQTYVIVQHPIFGGLNPLDKACDVDDE